MTPSKSPLSERMRADAAGYDAQNSMVGAACSMALNSWADEVVTLERQVADLEAKLGRALAPPSQREILDTALRTGIGEDDVVADFIASRRTAIMGEEK